MQSLNGRLEADELLREKKVLGEWKLALTGNGIASPEQG